MSRIHDWSRVYWRNRDRSREYLADDEYEDLVEDQDLSIHRNSNGELVKIRKLEAPDDEDAEGPEHSYEVLLNGELVEDVTLDGENFDEEQFDVLGFSTRGTAREAASDLMRALRPIPAPDETNFGRRPRSAGSVSRLGIRSSRIFSRWHRSMPSITFEKIDSNSYHGTVSDDRRCIERLLIFDPADHVLSEWTTYSVDDEIVAEVKREHDILEGSVDEYAEELHMDDVEWQLSKEFDRVR